MVILGYNSFPHIFSLGFLLFFFNVLFALDWMDLDGFGLDWIWNWNCSHDDDYDFICF